MSRTCGGCTMCCKLMAVPEINKPGNEWCPSCKIGTGCQVYGARPEPCKVYECLWLQDDKLPDELRPDLSKVVLSVNNDSTAVVAYIDPTQSYAWQRGLMAEVLKRISDKFPVIVVCGSQRKMISSDPKVAQTFLLSEHQGDGTVVNFVPVNAVAWKLKS